MTWMQRVAALPARRLSVSATVLAVLAAAAALAVAARIQIPFWPVPMTAQTLAVLLGGALLGPRRGTAAVATYLLAGAAGLPVFAQNLGPAALVGPTGGYLLGFLPAAYLAGLAAQRGWMRSWPRAFGSMLAADAAIFAVGLAWLGLWMSASGSLTLSAWLISGAAMFLPAEAVKIALAAGAAGAFHRR